MRIHNTQIKRKVKIYESDFTKMMARVAHYLESTIDEAAKAEANRPRCSWCNNTGNLTEIRAIPHNTYLLCGHCLADEERES